MRPRRTVLSNFVFRLPGGTEDNDLWVERDADRRVISSVWELTTEERMAIAEGANVKLAIWGDGHPPVAMSTTNDKLGRGPQPDAI